MRLPWNDEESLFSIEESPFMNGNSPKSWADIVLVCVNKVEMNNPDYATSVIEDLLKEVK